MAVEGCTWGVSAEGVSAWGVAVGLHKMTNRPY